MAGFDRDDTFAASQGTSAPGRKSRFAESPSSARPDAAAEASNAQTQFMAAIESVSDGFALFDADDRMVHRDKRRVQSHGRFSAAFVINQFAGPCHPRCVAAHDRPAAIAAVLVQRLHEEHGHAGQAFIHDAGNSVRFRRQYQLE